MSSVTGFIVFLYVAFRLAEHGEAISTAGELQASCTGPLKKWSSETLTCVEYFATYLTWVDSEDACISAAPTGTKGRLLHPVGKLIDLTSFFWDNVQGWVGGYQYVTYPSSWTPKTAITNYRWMENGNCTTNFNVSEVSPFLSTFSSLEFADDDNSKVYLGYWNQGYFNFGEFEFSRFCQYHLPYDSTMTCDHPLETASELESFCKGGTTMKWSTETQTCIQQFTDLMTWEEAEDACKLAAPNGTIGRLMHPTGELVNVDSFFGTPKIGWVGGVQHIITTTNISNYRWMEDSVITTNFNASEISPLLSGFLTDLNTRIYLTWDGGYANRLAVEESSRFCQYYIPNHCDTVWTSWSECTASCDYGIRFRTQKQINLIGGVVPCPSESSNNELQTCNTQYCSSFPMPSLTQFTACNLLNGFFAKNRCYFLVNSVAKWNEIAPACEAATSGGQPGLLYDTNELQNHVWAFLLQNNPEIAIWWSIKYTQIDSASFKMEWMIDQSTGYLPARFPTNNQNLSPGSEKCLRIQLSQFTSMSNITLTKPEWADCDYTPPFPLKALCQTSEKFYADFRTQKNTRITIADTSSLIFPASVEKGAWFCGLRCRRTDRCIGFNFQESTGTCEPLTVDEELLVDGKLNWGGTDIQIFNKDTLAIGWNHYPRIY